MKRYKIFALIYLMATSLFTLQAMGAPEIQGDSIVYHEENFRSVSNSVDADLTIRLGEDWHIEATGDMDSLQRLDIYVTNGKLVIKRKAGLIPFTRIRDVKIDIALPHYDLQGISLSSSGNAQVEGLIKSENTHLNTSASGSIIASGDVEFLEVTSSSSGNINFEGNCREIQGQLSSSGESFLNIQAMKFDGSISGSGAFHMSGAALETKLIISSGGDFLGEDFRTESADISISGSGYGELTITEELEARLSSSGDLSYWGNPRIIQISTTGKGKLIRKE